MQIDLRSDLDTLPPSGLLYVLSSEENAREWVAFCSDEGNPWQVTFSHIPPGKYFFYVKNSGSIYGGYPVSSTPVEVPCKMPVVARVPCYFLLMRIRFGDGTAPSLQGGRSGPVLPVRVSATDETLGREMALGFGGRIPADETGKVFVLATVLHFAAEYAVTIPFRDLAGHEHVHEHVFTVSPDHDYAVAPVTILVGESVE